MCKFCSIACQLVGKSYMCRICWRKRYHNKKG